MRKLISSIVLFAMVVCGSVIADQDELLKFVPQQTRQMCYLNVKNFLDGGIIREARATNLDIETFFNKAEIAATESGFALPDLFQEVIICASNDAEIGMLVTTAVPAEKLAAFLTKFPEILNRPALNVQVTDSEQYGKVVKTDLFSVVYLTDTAILLLPADSNMRTVLSGLGKILPRNRELVNFARKDLRGNLFWAVAKTPSAREMKEDSTLATPFNKSVEFLYVKAFTEGENQDTLTFSGQAYCYEIRDAQKAARDFIAVVGILTGAFFSDDSELAAKVMEAFSFTSKGKEFNYNLKITPTLINEIGAYIDYKKQAQAGGYDVNNGIDLQKLMNQILTETGMKQEVTENAAGAVVGMEAGTASPTKLIQISHNGGGEMTIVKNVQITFDADGQPVSYQLNEVVTDRSGNLLNDSFRSIKASSPEAQKALAIYNEQKAAEGSSSSAN